MEGSKKLQSSLKLPDPVVIKNSIPCKGLKVLQQYIILGLEDGCVKVFDKTNLEELSSKQYLKAPVLKIAETLIAIIVQFKDSKGTIFILHPPNEKTSYVMEVALKIETQVQSFTTFSSSVIQKSYEKQQILIAMPSHDQMHIPKVYLLNDQAQSIESQILIESRINQATKTDSKQAFPKSNKSTDKKQNTATSLNGCISCLYFTDCNGHPELFVGYESGAIGCFRLYSDDKEEIKFTQVISTQKLIQDPNIHHVLSMNAICFNPGQGDFKLAIGYFSQLLQTIDFTLAGDNDTYLIQSQKMTDLSYCEKPGIGCLASTMIGNKGLIISGGFDHRIRMVSAKTLKLLVNIPFHQGVVDSVQIETKSQSEVIVYATSEDGYLSIWNLNV